jgi:branched-chain amino acid transport system permease protein
MLQIDSFGAAGCSTGILQCRQRSRVRQAKRGVVVAEAFGIDVPRTKRIAFVYAALLAGISGWLYAHMQRSVNPTPFDIEASIEYLLMLVVGGGAQVCRVAFAWARSRARRS